MDFTNRPRSPQSPRPTNQLSADDQFNPEELPPVDPNPQQRTIPPRKNGKVKKIVLGLILMLLIVGLAAAAGWAYMEAEQLKDEVSHKESELQVKTQELASLKMAHEKGELENEGQASLPEMSEEDRMKLAASNYVCILNGISCDKSEKSVIRVIEAKPDSPGFALVKVSDATNASTNLYLKQSGSGNEWVVIYDGQNTPPSEVVEKFKIPDELLAS